MSRLKKTITFVTCYVLSILMLLNVILCHVITSMIFFWDLQLSFTIFFCRTIEQDMKVKDAEVQFMDLKKTVFQLLR